MRNHNKKVVASKHIVRYFCDKYLPIIIIINSSLTTTKTYYFLLVYRKFMPIDNGLLFSIHFLCRIIDIAYCVTMIFILLKVYLITFLEIWNFSSIIYIEGMCIEYSPGIQC